MGRLPCDMKDVELGIRAMEHALEGSNVDARKVINEVYLGRGDGDVNNRRNVRRAFVDVSLAYVQLI